MTDASVLHPDNEVIVRLAEGQSPPPTPTPRTTHLVQSGQSLWLIAALYNLTLEQLMELNELTVESIIRAGDELLVRLPTPTPQPTETATPTPVGAAQVALAVQPSPSPVEAFEGAPISTPVADEFLAAGPQDNDASGLTVWC